MMGFLKLLFGSQEVTPEEKKAAEEQRTFDSLKYEGIRAMRAGQIQLAIDCFQNALKLKEDLEIRDHLSVVLARNDEMSAAYRQLEILAEAVPDNAAVHIRMARLAYMAEDYERIKEACQKVLAIDENNAEAYYFYAQAHIGTGHPEEAITLLAKAIDAEPQYGEAYLLRGETLLKMRMLEEAAKDADYLLEHGSENEDVLLLKARIEKLNNRNEEAISYYGKAIDVNPFCMAAYWERGATKKETGDKIGAEEDMQHANELAEEMNKDATLSPTPEGIEQKVKQRYKDMDPYGVFSNN